MGTASETDDVRISKYADDPWPLRVAKEHKWKTLSVVTTLGFLASGWLMDALLGWGVQGGVAAAFTVIWVFNIVFVWLFLQFIRVAIEFAEA